MRASARDRTLLCTWWTVALVCLILVPLGRADTPAEVKQPVLCSIQANNCDAPAKDQKRAADAYWKGIKLEEKDLARAYDEFTEAAQLVPGNIDYVNARELVRTSLVQRHIESGNRLLADGRRADAAGEFRAALLLDAANPFAEQRLRDALGDAAPLSPGLRMVERSDPLQLRPNFGQADFHYRGDARGLYEMIARSFGVSASFDPSFTSRQVRFEVEKLDFKKAMELAGMVSKSFWAPLSESEFVVAADTPENHRQLDRMSLRTFYVTAATTQDLNDIANTLRGVFEIRNTSVNASKNLITVRAPQTTLDAATTFLEQLSTSGPPQVMLDVQVFEIDHSLLRNLGTQLPIQFQMFSLAGAASALSQANSQQLINQLISSGGINQANSAGLQALLAQLQQSQLSPLLTTPFATFGGGLTLFAVTFPSGTANFQFNTSSIKTLQRLTLRAIQGKPASMLIGERYPILNATFAPIFNSPAIAQTIQNNTFQAAFPSVSYEDLGISMKATPSIHGESDVTLEIETDLKALTGQDINGVPVISNRTYKSTITVKNGEAAVVAGDLNHSEQLSIGGTPLLGDIAGLGLLTASQTKDIEDDEFLVVITPHILDAPPSEAQAVWLPAAR